MEFRLFLTLSALVLVAACGSCADSNTENDGLATHRESGDPQRRIIRFTDEDLEDNSFRVSINGQYLGQNPRGDEIEFARSLPNGTYRMSVTRVSGTRQYGTFEAWLWSGWGRNIMFNEQIHSDQVVYGYSSQNFSWIYEMGFQSAKVRIEMGETIELEFRVY